MSIMAFDADECGKADPEALPVHTKFDYVEVYSYDEVEKSFYLNFRDDFDYFDDNIWDKADHYTYSDHENASTHMEENISFTEDGHLSLKLAVNHEYDDGEHDEDFHVLPAPKDGTLDQAIEKATRVAVTMVRT
jgi:hypothetical protein